MARAVRWPAGAVATGAGSSGESQRLAAASGCDGCLLLAQVPAGYLVAGLAAGSGAEGCCSRVEELQRPACHSLIVKAQHVMRRPWTTTTTPGMSLDMYDLLFPVGIWCMQLC